MCSRSTKVQKGVKMNKEYYQEHKEEISEISLTLVTVAKAPLVLPLSTIPSFTNPKKSPRASAERDAMSIFKIVDVDEYVGAKS